MNDALIFLHELNKQFPPCQQKHNMTVEDDRLIVTVFYEDGWYRFIIDPPDMEKDPYLLAEDVYTTTLLFMVYEA